MIWKLQLYIYFPSISSCWFRSILFFLSFFSNYKIFCIYSILTKYILFWQSMLQVVFIIWYVIIFWRQIKISNVACFWILFVYIILSYMYIYTAVSNFTRLIKVEGADKLLLYTFNDCIIKVSRYLWLQLQS